jgi:hypothetical protein
MFALSAVSIWFTFLRPVAPKTAVGIIRTKTVKPAGEYWQQPAGARSSFLMATKIPIAECYVFGIQMDGQAGEARVSLNTVAAQAFDVGHRVRIQYVKRGLPLIWKRIYVTDMVRAE